MKVAGSAILTFGQQRQLVDGALINVPRDRLPFTAVVGDLVWVKEPYARYTSRGHGRQNVDERVPGPINVRIPESIRSYLHELRARRMNGSDLRRDESRATLEVMVIDKAAATARCRVYMQQVDELLKARAA